MSVQSHTFGPDFILQKSTNIQTPDTKKKSNSETCILFGLDSGHDLGQTIPYEHEPSIDDLVHDFTDLHVSQDTQTGLDMNHNANEVHYLQQMYELMPSVCHFLCEADLWHLERFLQILSLMNTGDFPLDNICYTLFIDVIQWYHVFSTSFITYMLYSDDVRRCWYIGK